MLNRITVVGAGNVGATAAQRLAEQQLARTVVLVDVIEGVPQGKGLDQWQSAPIEGFDTRIIGANDYGPAAGSEVVVVTAGIARKPGMSRDDLVRTNADIVQQVARQIKQHCPTAIVVVVSNPLDVMCWVTQTVPGFPREPAISRPAPPIMPLRPRSRRWSRRSCSTRSASSLARRGSRGSTGCPGCTAACRASWGGVAWSRSSR